MSLWPFYRRQTAPNPRGAAVAGNPDPVAFLEALARARVGDGYGHADRYRDFRATFLADAAGRRVLWQILEWSHLFAPVTTPGDPYGTHFRDGERNIGLHLLATLNAEPAPQIPQAQDENTEQEE